MLHRVLHIVYETSNYLRLAKSVKKKQSEFFVTKTMHSTFVTFTQEGILGSWKSQNKIPFIKLACFFSPSLLKKTFSSMYSHWGIKGGLRGGILQCNRPIHLHKMRILALLLFVGKIPSVWPDWAKFSKLI
jgi:hypothetical protein